MLYNSQLWLFIFTASTRFFLCAQKLLRVTSFHPLTRTAFNAITPFQMITQTFTQSEPLSSLISCLVLIFQRLLCSTLGTFNNLSRGVKTTIITETAQKRKSILCSTHCATYSPSIVSVWLCTIHFELSVCNKTKYCPSPPIKSERLQ